MEKRILEIEFDSKNYEKIGYLFDAFCIMHRMDSGMHIDWIDKVLTSEGRTKEILNSMTKTINDDIQRMKEYFLMNGANPNWLEEYKDIDQQDFHYMLT